MEEEVKHPYGNIDGIATLSNDPIAIHRDPSILKVKKSYTVHTVATGSKKGKH